MAERFRAATRVQALRAVRSVVMRRARRALRELGKRGAAIPILMLRKYAAHCWRLFSDYFFLSLYYAFIIIATDAAAAISLPYAIFAARRH